MNLEKPHPVPHSINGNTCKICGERIKIFEHTARCCACGVLLYYPYPTDNELLATTSVTNSLWTKWYSESCFFNHINFTNMFRFVFDRTQSMEALDILDYGGGGGQFALIAKSHMPNCKVYITDICDDGLLHPWAPMNRQIRFIDFEKNEIKFDVIFLNDVFEHVNNPVQVLKLLVHKLKEDGQLFIDTPKQFWLYTVLRLFTPSLYSKLLKGTVTKSHLQIWSKKSFIKVVKQAGLHVINYKEVSEYTMPPSFYLKNMSINNPFIKLLGILFYRNAKWLAKNKIICVCKKEKR